MATVCVSAVLGALLLCTWLQDRGQRALLWWGPAYLILAVGVALISLRGVIPKSISIDIANAVLLFGAGCIWAGTRRFESRDTPLLWLLIAPIAWLLICRVPFFATDIKLRIVVLSLMTAAFLLLSANELWKGRKEALVSRWPAISIFASYGVIMLLRIFTTLFLMGSISEVLHEGSWYGVVALATLLYLTALAFVLLALTKERMELRHKRAALIDPLTGLANRRSFLSDGRTSFRDALRSHRAAALLVFDLDEFKAINDCCGHAVGDQVLRTFAAAVRAELRETDLVGRIGGEEFAALLMDCDRVRAVDVAERIRRSFAKAAARVDAYRLDATVSIGIAELRNEQELASLLAAADRAVYRAKADGRNCVRDAQEGIAPHRPGGPKVGEQARETLAA
jgi:diguanylate cyclase (GGDEF)-like protein